MLSDVSYHLLGVFYTVLGHVQVLVKNLDFILNTVFQSCLGRMNGQSKLMFECLLCGL